MNQSPIEAIGALISPAQRFLLITHAGPDGDAIGSLLGMGRLLRDLGKDVTLACQDAVPETLAWLPGSAGIARSSRLGTGPGPYDCVISLDCSDERRMGSVYQPELAALPLINIDHHVTNTGFGTLNWVDPASVATAEMVLSLADRLAWPLGPSAATCLLAGIITDTRSFRTMSSGPPALRAALRLIEAGASLGDVARQALDQQPLAWVRLLGLAIAGLTLEDGVLWTEVTRAMRHSLGLGEDGASGLANFLARVREADIVLVFTERDDGTVDVSLRAAPGYDVAQVALDLGGGGHPQAAGCTLGGELPAVRERVLAEVRLSLAAQRRASPVGVGQRE
jgi:phosphoesterase RecJ-like protein